MKDFGDIPFRFRSGFKVEGATTGRIQSKTPTHEEVDRTPVKKGTKVHLYWLWYQGPPAMRGVTRAISLCGARDLSPKLGEVTTHRVDATCSKCLEKSNARQSEVAG